MKNTQNEPHRESPKIFGERIPDSLLDRFPVGADIFPYSLDEIDPMMRGGKLFIKTVLEKGREL